MPKSRHPSSCPIVPHPGHLFWISFGRRSEYFGKCYKSDQFISLLTLWWGFLCFSVTHGHCQAWRQLQLLVGWVLAVLGDGDSLFPSCKYRLPFGLLCSSKENINSSTGQVGLCTGNSTFALLLAQLLSIP